MTYKEKYEMALETVQEILDSGSDSIRMSRLRLIMQSVFPELKESEDERIKKFCEVLIRTCFMNELCTKEEKDDCLAWLEKQADKDKLIKELGKYKVKYTQEVLQNYLNSMTNKDDERLRKTTIAFLKEFADKGYENAVECIDWLEKQGKTSPFNKERLMEVAKPETEDEKKKPSDAAENLAKAVANAHPSFDFEVGVPDEDECPKWFEKQGEKLHGKTALEMAKEEKSPAESLGISPEKYEEIINECIYGESTDKFKPKFKVGDWVVSKTSNLVYHVDSILLPQSKCYYLSHDGGVVIVSFTDEQNYHLWTIQDAKDGDVLVNGSNIFIFSYLSDTRAMGYCHINLDDGRFYDDKGKNECFGLIDADFSPATKKQRDTLIKAMTDAGYTFDFEKKELKKIEQELANSAKTCKDDTLLDLLQKMPSCITVDGIDYHFVMKKTIAYMAFYEGEGDGNGKVIFWMAGEPVPLLTAMLDKLKNEGLLE